ncbi:MAG: 16S rRNA (cytidine(1402)-2'-O)-methyltransferase [Flavobacteriales bacterium]|jgi:16S rRNA (cytidine1402-2'-O)-methyltransferase|nr:16S rRNA (cytidine(1402)-2'-O)-methyltransferase [Flavobacteriales bacterium]
MDHYGKLYFVPTPIGNLEDMTFRAIKVLKKADEIYAEDTRTTRKLLNHFEIENNLLSFHLHNEHKLVDSILAKLKQGRTLALVSDAGTPAISDPGFLLSRACVQNYIETECLPGATAFVPALVKSGFPCEKFVFEGFLPPKKGRQSKLLSYQEEKRTIVLYESPHKIAKTVKQIVEFIGPDRQIAICREISKLYEECLRGTAEELAEILATQKLKGEIVLLIAPSSFQFEME